MKKSKIYRSLQLLLFAMLMLITGISMLIALDDGIMHTATHIQRLSQHYTMETACFYVVGFLLSIAVSISISDLIWRHYPRQFTKLLLLRVFTLAFMNTIILLLYIDILFPVLVDPALPWHAIFNINIKHTISEAAVIFIITLVVSFVYYISTAIHRKLGSRTLWNFLIGKYTKPMREQRIIMFIDLSDSTTIAEQLGMYVYAEFIQDYYFLLGQIIEKSGGDIYQYVGDEIVVTWPQEHAKSCHYALGCYFDIVNEIQNNAKYYQDKYGYVPSFKCGVNSGEAMVAEVGYVRMVISYIGDSFNTTSRIMNKCYELDSRILISETVKHGLLDQGEYMVELKGAFVLKGKQQETVIYSVKQI